MMTFLLSNFRARNKTTYSEFGNLEILSVMSYKVGSLKVPYVKVAICGKYSGARLAYQIFNYQMVTMDFRRLVDTVISQIIFVTCDANKNYNN
jgi:hypothetical protein